MRIESRIGVQRNNDDMLNLPRLGNQGELIVSNFSGQFYEQTMRGNGFIYATTTAVSVVALGTAGAPNLWNPAGSGKLLVLEKIIFAAAAVGTPVASAFTYGLLQNAGSQIGTAAPVVSLTQVAPVSALLGSGIVSVIRFAPATISLTTAPTLFAVAAQSGGTATVTTAALQDDINGKIIIPPGNLFQIGASTATSTTYFITIYGLELPIPLIA